MLHKILAVVNKSAPDCEMYLYGSQARGDKRKHSDWDLLILLNRNNISFDYETKFMDEFYEIELETGEIIAPIFYTKNEWLDKYSLTTLFENIKKEGIRIK